jgi:hypothetical protein
METRFYIADEITLLPNGKVLAVGLYADARLLLNPDAPSKVISNLVLPKLAILLSLSSVPVGSHELKPWIKFPDGTSAPEMAMAALERTADDSAVNVLCHFVPFPVPQVGDYEFGLTVGGRTFRETFSIHLAPGYELAAATKTEGKAHAAKPAPAKKAARAPKKAARATKTK